MKETLNQLYGEFVLAMMEGLEKDVLGNMADPYRKLYTSCGRVICNRLVVLASFVILLSEVLDKFLHGR